MYDLTKVTKFSTLFDVSYFMVEDRMEMEKERVFKEKKKKGKRERLGMD